MNTVKIAIVLFASTASGLPGEEPGAWGTFLPGSAKKLYYRVSNNGLKSGETGRFAVGRIQAFSDQECSKEIVATFKSESGHHRCRKPTLHRFNCTAGNGAAAFDSNRSTCWIPQCRSCDESEAWVIFSTTEEAKCIIANGLGTGSSWKGRSWDVGILVELQDVYGWWKIVMLTPSGNKAIRGMYEVKETYNDVCAPGGELNFEDCKAAATSFGQPINVVDSSGKPRGCSFDRIPSSVFYNNNTGDSDEDWGWYVRRICKNESQR
jgi:hypothetical protein